MPVTVHAYVHVCMAPTERVRVRVCVGCVSVLNVDLCDVDETDWYRYHCAMPIPQPHMHTVTRAYVYVWLRQRKQQRNDNVRQASHTVVYRRDRTIGMSDRYRYPLSTCTVVHVAERRTRARARLKG